MRSISIGRHVRLSFKVTEIFLKKVLRGHVSFDTHTKTNVKNVEST